MSQKIHHIFILPDPPSPCRLDQALTKLLPDYSRTQIQAWIESGQVLLNGITTQAKTKIHGGEKIEITTTLKRQPAWEAEEIPLTIIYEDEALIVINKPAGMVVHPGAGNTQSTLLNALLHHAPALKALPRAGIIHRLDKDTSGLLLVAKTPGAYKKLTSQLKKRTILREYQTIVAGTLISGATIDAPLTRHPVQRKRMAVLDTGKPAITHYRIMEKYRAFTRLKVKLETGRTHQIRVHMAYIRHPIVGDKTYGPRLQIPKKSSPALADFLRQFKRQALHAFTLGITHPVTKEWIQWEASLPQDMQELIAVLKEDTACS